MRKIKVGTRSSNLAVTQTEWVVNEIMNQGVKNEFEIKKITTRGDRILNVTLSKVGGKGLFVKEIEKAMYNKEIDFAVHSMKDMPSDLPEGLIISAIPKREDHRDVLISKSNLKLKELPSGSIIGTSSLRRSSQVLQQRPDLKIKWIRGNIETRLKRMEEEDYDAIILAASGLKRIGMEEKIVTEYLDPEIFIPAVGQGALAIESRENDYDLKNIVNKIHCESTAKAIKAERKFLHLLQGGCRVPIGGYACIEDGEIVLTCFVGTPDGKTMLKEKVRGQDPIFVGEKAAHLLIERGAKEIVEKVRQELEE